MDGGQSMVLVDVRRQSDYDEDPNLIPGATWYDLEQMDTWSHMTSQKMPSLSSIALMVAAAAKRHSSILQTMDTT